MYIEWLIIYILYIQGGPKWYCNRVIFKYLTVVFLIGKEGMRSGPSRFRRGALWVHYGYSMGSLAVPAF